MNPIEHLETSWKKLDKILQMIIGGVNRRTLIRGAGISLNESENGVVISLTQRAATETAPPTAAAGGGTGTTANITWLAIKVMDSSCIQKTIYVRGQLNDPGNSITTN
jgi:hypothetical protein